MNLDKITYGERALEENSSSRLAHLLDLINEFNRADNFQQLIAQIGYASEAIMQAETGLLLLLDEDSDEFCIRSCTGPVSDSVKGKRIPREHRFLGWLAAHKRPFTANDIEVNTTFLGGELGQYSIAKNLICTPLLDQSDNLLGVIAAINYRNQSKLTDTDIAVFQTLADHATAAIEQKQDLQKRNNLLSEQDTHLKEIHHRVKNDLALLSGIVEIESFDVADKEARRVLKSIQSRIQSMAIVYELLSDTGGRENTEAGTYFKELAKGISRGLNNPETEIKINISADPVVLDPYKTLSCGLILNELMLNTYKHAFDESCSGTIDLSLIKDDDIVTIHYRDDGCGMPENFEIEDQDSLGYTMIQALTEQLDGTSEIVSSEGAHFVLQFKINSREENPALPNKVIQADS